MNKAAQALGRLAKGKPKNYSAAEIERRSKILAGINARKRKRAESVMLHAPPSSGEEAVQIRPRRSTLTA